MHLRSASRAALACLLATVTLASAGCGSKVIDLRDPPDPDPLPAASSPQNALLRLQWAWNHRDPAPLADLFSADYRFHCARTDSLLPEMLFRESEIEFSKRLFVSGTLTQPPARTVTLEFPLPLVVSPSSIPGQMAPWHVEIVTAVHAGIRVPNGDYRVLTAGRFGLVRGDSAHIPQELLDRGYAPDSTRWWIERWDEEFRVVPLAAPSEPFTVTALKAIYLELKAARPRL